MRQAKGVAVGRGEAVAVGAGVGLSCQGARVETLTVAVASEPHRPPPRAAGEAQPERRTIRQSGMRRREGGMDGRIIKEFGSADFADYAD